MGGGGGAGGGVFNCSMSTDMGAVVGASLGLVSETIRHTQARSVSDRDLSRSLRPYNQTRHPPWWGSEWVACSPYTSSHAGQNRPFLTSSQTYSGTVTELAGKGLKLFARPSGPSCGPLLTTLASRPPPRGCANSYDISLKNRSTGMTGRGLAAYLPRPHTHVLRWLRPMVTSVCRTVPRRVRSVEVGVRVSELRRNLVCPKENT